MHKFRSVWLLVEKELEIKDYPALNNLPLFLCSLSLVLGSSGEGRLHGARQPRSQGSRLPSPTERERVGDRTWERGWVVGSS